VECKIEFSRSYDYQWNSICGLRKKNNTGNSKADPVIVEKELAAVFATAPSSMSDTLYAEEP